MIGQTVSHYRILEKLGEGGMGVVYKAEDTKLRRTVALKFLPPELMRDSEAKERFLHEAQAAAALEHPHICNIYEIDESEDQIFIVMSCFDGQTLKEKIDSGPLKIDDALKIAVQAAEGLQAAHEKGIVHRDIKSANIMVTVKGQTKIMDFGLAKLKGQTKLTKQGTTLGTAAYMSPEQAQGVDVDHRTDIWSLGVVLYEMIAGQLPFRGEYEQAVVYSIMNEEPESLTALRTGVPMELERIVNKTLAKDPLERYQHADDLVVDLRHLKKDTKPGISVPGKTIKTETPKKQKMGLVIGAVAVILVLLLGFWFLSKKQSQPPPVVPEDLKSIAVLPFVNMSADKNQEYFCDGMTEDIITKLSQVTDLKVISRTSVMLYKDRKKRIRDIGEELNVAVILEGSVRKGGGRLRITAQLINAKTEAHIWADAFDRDIDIKDVFNVQSEVALEIVNALQAKLSPREREKLKKKPTENLKAYDYYLMGRNYYLRFRKQDNEHAIELYKKALELDPGYARAYAGLGEVYAQRVLRYGFPPKWLEKAVELSKKAISINPDCAEAYKSLGLVYIVKGWLKKAIKATRKSFKLNPDPALALPNLVILLCFTGEFEEAMTLAKNGLSTAPTDPWCYHCIGLVYRGLGIYAKAVEWSNKALELQPSLSDANLNLIHCYLALGRYQQALEQSRKFLSAAPGRYTALFNAGYAALFSNKFEPAKQYLQRTIELYSTRNMFFLCNTTLLGYIYWKRGEKAEARKLFDQSLNFDRKALEQGVEHLGIPHDIATIHAIRGDKEEALKWLQKVFDIGWIEFPGFLTDSLWANLRSDKRFKNMIAEANAKAYKIRKRIEKNDR
ncbi:MAG: protein kinase [Candidatus Aminicenantes bacterium]|nr:protein kinase [Candidatus Aminicenantes bacterium]NIM82289.1 protein kinase [Candidatus Aminicenantes bacterium]NIN21672.1 protein kinase [Candidatus Aminicenantes bacterium]NIN45481.1 protein kinase [Candidatus Aminicenantes bacterium]NIN88312.1 protein kinase [Candidatus Aminicenantes bacterium]